MGGKGGGGGVDTTGLEEATKQGTALQKQIYEQTRDDVQPWYRMGVGSVSKLSDLLGVQGGSVKSRQDIYNELLPQFTRTEQIASPSNNASPIFVDSTGQAFDFRTQAPGGMMGRGRWTDAALEAYHNYNATPEPETQSITDYEALNQAVNERLGEQGTPENYGSLLERFDLTKFEEDPGYQFRKDESNRALERAMAAQGVTLGGAGFGDINPQVARAMQEQNQGLAAQEYQNAYNRYVQDNLNTYNMLMGAAGMGQNSTGIMATGGQNYATNVGNLQTGLASAQLNAQMAQASQPSMFSSLLGAGAQLGGAYLMSDIRTKENIEIVGSKNGLSIIRFNYKGNSQRWEGVSAQEVEVKYPDAVKESNGIKHVNYKMIDIPMRKVG